LVTFKQRQYLFGAQCIWWIAALVQLDPALRYYLDHQEFPSKIQQNNLREPSTISMNREISSTPRDIRRQSDSDGTTVPIRNQYLADPLHRTRKGRINPAPKTKKQLKAKKKKLAKLKEKKHTLRRSIAN